MTTKATIQEINAVYQEIAHAFKNKEITRQQYRTLKGQSTAGNPEAARRGLATIRARSRA